jgi:hypothetical protein
MRHGTERAYKTGCRCDACRAANTEACYRRHMRMVNKGLSDGDPRHGTHGGYTNWGCRCPDCIVAGAEHNRLTHPPRAVS